VGFAFSWGFQFRQWLTINALRMHITSLQIITMDLIEYDERYV
jgi:hypothetical protein